MVTDISKLRRIGSGDWKLIGRLVSDKGCRLICWHMEYDVERGRMVLNRVMVMLFEIRIEG